MAPALSAAKMPALTNLDPVVSEYWIPLKNQSVGELALRGSESLTMEVLQILKSGSCRYDL